MPLKYILFFFSIIILFSCENSEKDKEISDEQVVSNNMIVKRTDDKNLQGFTYTSIKVDSLAYAFETQGINVTLNVNISDKALQQIAAENFGGMYLNLSVLNDSGTVYSFLDDVMAVKDDNRIHSNKDCFITKPGSRKILIHVPYRKIQLPEDAQTFNIKLDLLPVKFNDDSATSDYRIIKHIDNRPRATVTLSISVNAPKLFHTAISVKEFSLNTDVVDPGKFDFTLGGTGFPDLYWKLYCGDELIYFSKHLKNSTIYNVSSSSPEFYCTEKDLIRISTADYDNGPFNTDDIIESWTGSITELPIGKEQSLRLKKIKDFLVKREE